ncbi:MAG: PQQ-dependent sugar dehydrogenase, partial [Bacteroidetes bacterium]|nr:PQQ-dependent sugar dehydrogenase [Bacteroidota bacterium]
MKTFIPILLFVCFGILSCKKKATEDVPVGEPEIEVQTILTNYEIIWGMDVLPGGDLLFGEKRGRLYLLQNNTVTEITDLPAIDAGGQGGLLDVRLHPNYASNGWVYISYTSSTPSYALMLSRFKIINGKVVQLQDIFTAAGPGGHNGSRIAFDKNGFLFLSVGEGPSTGGGPNVANKNGTNPASPWGKIHRMNDDGTIPNTNPIISGNTSRNSIFTIGHRNPQGLVLHPQSGEIWASEHGPMGGDEINIIRSAANYGWPLYSLGRNYDGSVISNGHDAPGITPPIYAWTPSIG